MQNLISNYKERLGKLFLVNILTIARFPMILIFAHNLIKYLETGEKEYGAVSMGVSILIIFLDFIDGKLARKLDVATKLGQKFDIYSDFLYIFVGLIILIKYDVIDLYFILVISAKFLEFIIISKVMKGKFDGKKGKNYYYDSLGTLVSAVYYIIPLVSIALIYFQVYKWHMIIKVALMIITLATVLTSFYKYKTIICYLKKDAKIL